MINWIWRAELVVFLEIESNPNVQAGARDLSVGKRNSANLPLLGVKLVGLRDLCC